MRLQIPAYTDAWRAGCHFGELVRTLKLRPTPRPRTLPGAVDRYGPDVEIAVVRLDRSGATIEVVLADCREVV